jgi:uncharacterized protein (TIGR02687 family)
MNMKPDQMEQGLRKKLEKSRIVFWQDAESEFQDQLSDLSLGDVTIINIDEESQLELKQRIELGEPEQAFLLYYTQLQEEPARDWMHDIKLYSEHFYADSSSIILNELGIKQMALRHTVSQFKSFFGNKQRLARVKKVIPDNATREELEVSIMAAILKLDTASLSPILQNLLVSFSHDFDESVLVDFEKYGLKNALWAILGDTFGYYSDEPSLKDFTYKLLSTDCIHGTQGESLDSLKDHLLPLPHEASEKRHGKNRVYLNSAKRAAAVNFVSGWRESRSVSDSYNAVAEEVSTRLECRSKLSSINDVDTLLEVETFELGEQKLIALLAEKLPALSLSQVEQIVSRRLNGHWCFTKNIYASIYKAILAAKQFFELKLKYTDGFKYETAGELYKGYSDELHQFDRTYRIFSENALVVSHHGSDILKLTGLVDEVESLYVDWYLNDLAIEWGRLVDQEKLLEHWKLAEVKNQYDFYRNEILSVLKRTQIKRVFVIISDALRYEVAKEINDEINNEKRFKSDISSQLGVVPSYTQLGMASLLPHQELSIHLNNKVEIKVDGTSSHGLENRKKVLSNHAGLAFKSSDVLQWTNQEGREKVKGAEIVYIYHDEIDAKGDKAATEDETFEAARNAVNEIKNLVSRIINKLNGSRVVITADHGFLFKSSDVTDSDKTAFQAKPPGAVEAKKRYVIGSNLPTAEYYWNGTTKVTAKSVCDTEFIVPRGSNRFNFVGGAKFIHGGIMPQEICVPVMHVRELDIKAQTKHSKEPVGVVPLNSPIKIVANIDKLEFLQTDPVGEKHKPRQLELFIEDPNGQKVSSIEKVSFDSTSEDMSERKRTIQIALNGTGFDRAIPYRLVLWRPDEKDVYASHSVVIDLAFEDDFF